MSLTPLVRVVLRQVLPAGLLAVVLMTSSTPAQSLGDVARQEQARRKSASSGKVYTNGDLHSAPAPATAPPTPAPSGAAKAPQDSDRKPAAPDAKPGEKSTAGEAKEGGA